MASYSKTNDPLSPIEIFQSYQHKSHIILLMNESEREFFEDSLDGLLDALNLLDRSLEEVGLELLFYPMQISLTLLFLSECVLSAFLQVPVHTVFQQQHNTASVVTRPFD